MMKLFLCIILCIYQCSEQAAAYKVPGRLLIDEADQVRYISPAFLDKFIELVADHLRDIDKAWKEEQAKERQLIRRMEAMKQKMVKGAQQTKKDHFDLMKLYRNQGADAWYNEYRNYRSQLSRQLERLRELAWQREQKRWQKVQKKPKTLTFEAGPQWVKLRTESELQEEEANQVALPDEKASEGEVNPKYLRSGR